MPTYQYACTDCGHRFELVQSFTDPPASECPVCGAPVRKVFSSVGVVFKGSGFYRNDSRESAQSASAAAAKSGQVRVGRVGQVEVGFEVVGLEVATPRTRSRRLVVASPRTRSPRRLEVVEFVVGFVGVVGLEVGVAAEVGEHERGQLAVSSTGRRARPQISFGGRDSTVGVA